jgi:hypothetical protein
MIQGDGVIVLRDATDGTTPFSTVDHYGGLTLPQAMAVVEHLSAIHAAATAQLIKGSTDDNFEHLFTDQVVDLIRLFLRRSSGDKIS